MSKCINQSRFERYDMLFKGRNVSNSLLVKCVPLPVTIRSSRPKWLNKCRSAAMVLLEVMVAIVTISKYFEYASTITKNSFPL